MMLLNKKEETIEGTVVWTDHQIAGRGQRGNQWHSLPGLNLLASVMIKPKWLPLSQQHLLTLYTAVSIREALEAVSGLPFKVKWPNDIYIRDKKIAGILCESSISGQMMDLAVLGFGVNVNQTEFELETASSVYLESGKKVDRQEILESILISMEKWYHPLKAGNNERLLTEYYEHLLGYRTESKFRTSGGQFQGIIVGLDNRGRLMIETTKSAETSFKPGNTNIFDLKEITMIISLDRLDD